MCAMHEMYKMRLQLMNTKAFQHQGDAPTAGPGGMATPLAGTADLDTGEKSRDRDMYDDSGGRQY